MTIKEEYDQLRELIPELDYVWIFENWKPLFKYKETYISRHMLWRMFDRHRIGAEWCSARKFKKAWHILIGEYWWYNWCDERVQKNYWAIKRVMLEDYSLLNDIII